MQNFKKSPNKVIQKQIDEDNFKRVSRISILVIIFESIMIILSLVLKFDKNYRNSYFALLVLVIIYSFVIRTKFSRQKYIMSFLLISATYVFSIWGIFISILDLSHNLAPFVYLINISFIISLYYFNPREALIYNLVNITIFFISLLLLGFLSFTILLNVSFFHIVLYFISVEKYNFYVSNFQDKLDLKEANKELKLLSTVDQLSGCKNRRGLFYELEKYEGQVIFALLTDIDNFKDINDNFGHDIGDLVIVNFAKILQANFGKDKVFRIGGDEFFIIGNDTFLDSYLKKFEIARNQVKDIISVKSKDLEITTSAGYTNKYFKSLEQFDELFKLLDLALYKSKGKGKNQITKAEDE